ncbi:MAG: B12-binding domain-containing radical SAM protein [Chloroflexi bacterium]|nr:B12-binding domain-containing radical SAM protein [Chloroflexota bacterium]
MKILLVNAIEPRRHFQHEPGLGLAYLAAFIRQRRPNAQVRIAIRQVAAEIADFAPDFIGISSVSENFDRAKAIASLAKRHGLPVVIGGAHITALPQTLPPEMDIGVIGEGEETLLELTDTLDGHGWTPAVLSQVAGIVFHTDGGPCVTTPRPVIEALETIPPPARDLLPIEKGGTVTMLSSRGCPYKCVFCSSTRFWNKMRMFSAEYVVREMGQVLSDYRPSHISFVDDLFVASRPRLRRLADLIEQRGIHRRVELSVSCRANLVDEELARLLRRMNVVLAWIGLESGSEAVLEYLKGGNVSVADNERAVETLSRAGLEVHGTFVIGAPREASADIEATYDFIKRSALADFCVYPLSPLPGTPLWDYALQRGLVSEDMEWGRLNYETVGQANISLSELVSRDEMAHFFSMFSGERKRRRRRRFWRRCLPHLFAQLYRRPHRIVPWLRKRLAGRWGHGQSSTTRMTRG